jgi:outer membrane protein assembly factor BamA
LDFPIAEDILRGDVFTDEGDVETDAKVGTMRASVGLGFRLILPFLGNQPLAVDFGFSYRGAARYDEQELMSVSRSESADRTTVGKVEIFTFIA